MGSGVISPRSAPSPGSHRRNSETGSSGAAVDRLLQSISGVAEEPVQLGKTEAQEWLYSRQNTAGENASLYHIGTPALSANPSMFQQSVSSGGTEEDEEETEIVSLAPSPVKGEGMAPVSHVLKLIMLGDASVGKTALIQRFVNGKYQVLPYKPTVGADFYSQKLEYEDKVSGEKSLITLQIWDTAGQERYKSLASSFYRGADVCILVEDASRASQMSSIEQWHKDFLLHASPLDQDNFPFVFLLNKADLVKDISSAEREWKRKVCDRFHVSERQAIAASAKSGHSVEKAFFAAAKIGVKRAVEAASKIKQQSRSSPNNNAQQTHLINHNARSEEEQLRADTCLGGQC